MKKIVSFICLLLSLLLVINVKADSGPPELPEFEFEVINKDGAKCYQLDANDNFELVKTIPYGYKYSDDEDKSHYITKISDKYYETYYEDVNCYIEKQDVIINKEKFVEDESLKSDYSNTLKALIDLKIYSGPSKRFFEELGTINKNTEFKAEYSYGSYWYYVDYNGIKGYVSSEDNAIVHNDGERVLVTYKKEPIYKDGASDEIIGYIPSTTEIKTQWRTDYTIQAYITYNGLTGFIDISEVASKCDGYKIKANRNEKVYESLEHDDNYNTLGKVIGTIEADKDYDVKYCNDDYDYYGHYTYYLPSVNGWIEEYYEKAYIIETDADGEVSIHYSSEDKDKPTEPETPTEPEEPIEPKKEEPTPQKGLSNSELILICIGAGVLIALTSLVTILLVNRRNKNTGLITQEDNQVEVPKDEEQD